MNLGKRLEYAIANNHIEKQQFAKDIGISKEYLSRLINGKKHINENIAAKASIRLGVSIDYLLGKTTDPWPGDSDAEKWNKQQYLLSPLNILFQRFGLIISPVILIGETRLFYDDTVWVGNGCQFTEEGLIQFLQNVHNAQYGVILSSNNEELFMPYEEYLKWQKEIINCLGGIIANKLPHFEGVILKETVPDNIYATIQNNNLLR